MGFSPNANISEPPFAQHAAIPTINALLALLGAREDCTYKLEAAENHGTKLTLFGSQANEINEILERGLRDAQITTHVFPSRGSSTLLFPAGALGALHRMFNSDKRCLLQCDLLEQQRERQTDTTRDGRIDDNDQTRLSPPNLKAKTEIEPEHFHQLLCVVDHTYLSSIDFAPTEQIPGATHNIRFHFRGKDAAAVTAAADALYQGLRAIKKTCHVEGAYCTTHSAEGAENARVVSIDNVSLRDIITALRDKPRVAADAYIHANNHAAEPVINECKEVGRLAPAGLTVEFGRLDPNSIGKPGDSIAR